MDLLHILALALLQGLTEFLPISSSAHLILLPQLLGWADQGLAFDVAVHVGTLAAVVAYFRDELRDMIRDWVRSLAARRAVGDSHLAWAVLLGTLPAGLAGLLFKDVVETHLRSPLVIAWTTVGFGLLLGAATWLDGNGRSEHQLRWRDILLIGCAQALALIPGTSRSGITITAGLFAGLSQQGAARFSFLLSIPVIVLAGGHHTLTLIEAGAGVDWSALVLGALLSGLAAYACIHFFLKLLARIGMMPFVAYRLLLGAWLLFLYA